MYKRQVLTALDTAFEMAAPAVTMLVAELNAPAKPMLRSPEPLAVLSCASAVMTSASMDVLDVTCDSCLIF